MRSRSSDHPRDRRLRAVINLIQGELCGHVPHAKINNLAARLVAARRSRLVVLSACESGALRHQPSRTSSPACPAPSRPSALRCARHPVAGVRCCDGATDCSVLRIRMAQGIPPPTALNRAQRWLRQATNASLAVPSSERPRSSLSSDNERERRP